MSRDSACAFAPMMWINADRAVYFGLLGNPTDRTFGGHAVYASPEGTHRIRIEDEAWQEARLSVVPPFVRHSVWSGQRTICNALLEGETIDAGGAPDWLRHGAGGVDDAALTATVRRAFARFAGGEGGVPSSTANFDRHLFGQAMHPARFERRIRAAVDQIKSAPGESVSARQCASRACLSESRFLHLFSDEVGVPFRKFKAWKRARAFLYHVTSRVRLTDVALDIGYPDTSHFSHSIRHAYGLTPTSICAGSRRLSLQAGV